MGQICTYIEELAYDKEFHGVVRGKKVDSKPVTVGNNTFIGTASGKAIWVRMKFGRGNNRDIIFPIPISQMRNVQKVVHKGKPHIVYDMIKGMHNSATFGKKDPVTKRRKFRPKKSCFNCGSYNPTADFLAKYPPRQSQGQSYSTQGTRY